jgi:hypothetical protein
LDGRKNGTISIINTEDRTRDNSTWVSILINQLFL